MKSAKLLTSLVVVALVMSLFVIAGSPASVRAADPTKTPAPTATLPPGSVEGTLTIWVNVERAPILEAAAKEFTKKFGVPVKIQTMGFGDIRNNFVLAGPAKEGPDLIVGAHDWIGELNKSGLLAEVELDKAVSANLDPVGLKAFTYGGKLLGVPYQVEAVAMYYNKDLVPTAPKTFKEALDISKKLQDAKKVDQGIAIPAGDSYHNYAMFSGFGGGVFGRDKDGNYDPTQVILDSEGSIKGAKYLDQLVKDGYFKASTDYGVAADLFNKGKLAMFITGPWQLDSIKKSGVNFGVAKIPALVDGQPSRPFVGVQGFMVNKLGKNLLLAKAFLTDFIASTDVMDKLIAAQFGIAAWLPTREKQASDANVVGFAASVADGDPMPAIPEMSQVWDKWGGAVGLIYQQKAEPETAMKDAAKGVRDAIAKAAAK